jgi:2-haloacid dehalogenase
VPGYRLITFDVYTALFDVAGSLAPRVVAALGLTGDGRDLVQVWRRKQLEYAQLSNSLGRGRVPVRVITRRALDYALAQGGVDAAEPTREALVAAWDALSPWPEAEAVLAEVRARGYTTGLLSNGDADMLAALAARLSIAPAHVFASEEAGAYKPHPAVYDLPLQALNLKPGDVLHVAGSATDVMGARSAGLPCAWSNRARDRVLDQALRATFEFADLRGLLDQI